MKRKETQTIDEKEHHKIIELEAKKPKKNYIEKQMLPVRSSSELTEEIKWIPKIKKMKQVKEKPLSAKKEVKSKNKIDLHSSEDFQLNLSKIANDISEEPHSNIKLLKELFNIVSSPSVSTLKVKLTLVSLLSIFKGLIPSYKIVIQKNEPEGGSISAERKYEKSLLSYYHKFMNVCVSYLRKRGEDEDDLGIVSYKIICDLFLSASEFNYADDLMYSILKHINHNKSCADIGSNTLIEYISLDPNVRSTAVVVKALSNMIKSLDYKLKYPNVPYYCMYYLAVIYCRY